jgi:hypothetical protein
VLPQVALSFLCKTKIYINSQLTAAARSVFFKTSEPGLPDSYKSPCTKPLPSVCYPYFSGLPAFGSSPAEQQSVRVLEDFQELQPTTQLSEPEFTELRNSQNNTIMSEYPVNLLIGVIGVQTIRRTHLHPFHIGGTT